MIKIPMTEYTFDVSALKRITVKVYGKNTEENREKAEKEAVRRLKESIDETDLYCTDARVYTDYEIEYRAEKEAV